MLNWNKKEAPLKALAGMGGGVGRGGKKIVATGGNVDALQPGNGYTYHTFTSPGTFEISNGNGVTFQMLLVAGGGGGGGRNANGSDGGGGGGAGGLIYVSGVPLANGTYNVVIGGGGQGKGADNVAAAPANALGGDTTFTLSGPNAHITAKGGGGGGSGPTGGPLGPYGNGGSGGGAGSGGGSQPSYYGTTVPQPVTLLSAPQYSAHGNRGGDGDTSAPHAASGGGGANNNGVNGRNDPGGGPGGNGRQYQQFEGPLIGVPALNPTNGYFAGGGAGGGGGPGTHPGGNGGQGGGGPTPASNGSPLDGNDGLANSGGGAGGGSGATGSGGSGGHGGDGGPGIICIRYAA